MRVWYAVGMAVACAPVRGVEEKEGTDGAWNLGVAGS